MTILTAVRDFVPESIHQAINNVTAERAPEQRHQRLLELGESCLNHFASVALSEYRSDPSRPDDPEFESSLATTQKFSLGHFPEVFKKGVLSGSSIFPDVLDLKIEGPVGFRKVVEQLAELEGVRSIGAPVERTLNQAGGKEKWVNSWITFTNYRNRAHAHTVSHGWPSLTADDYYQVMTPLLEGLLEQLVAAVSPVFEACYVAELQVVQHIGRHEYVHQLLASHGGRTKPEDIELPTSVFDTWYDEDWHPGLGGYLLVRESTKEVVGPYWDLGRQGAPPARCQEPESETEQDEPKIEAVEHEPTPHRVRYSSEGEADQKRSDRLDTLRKRAWRERMRGVTFEDAFDRSPQNLEALKRWEALAQRLGLWTKVDQFPQYGYRDKTVAWYNPKGYLDCNLKPIRDHDDPRYQRLHASLEEALGKSLPPLQPKLRAEQLLLRWSQVEPVLEEYVRARVAAIENQGSRGDDRKSDESNQSASKG